MGVHVNEALVAARGGDTGSRERLVELTRPQALAWARGLVSDPATAEDVAQEALLEVWTSLESLREPAAYLAWVKLLVRKHADRHRRRLHPVLALDLLVDVRDAGPGPAEQTIDNDRDQLVRRMLALAPDSDRRLLDLRYVEGWSDADLAELLEITPGAVRKRLFDARRRLKPAMATTLDLPLEPRRTAMTQRFGLVTDVSAGTLIAREAVVDETPLNTGLRVFDALLPWPRAGLIDLRGPVNTGGLVLLGEVLSGLHRQTPAALVGVAGREAATDGSSARLWKIVEDPAGQPERSRIFRGQPEAALEAGAELAGELAREGLTVLLVVDRVVAEAVGLDVLAQLPLGLAHGSVTVIRCAYWARNGEPVGPWPAAHTSIELSVEQAVRGCYPAVDLLESHSTLADPVLAETAREQVRRGRELERWVAQPLVSAEEFTGIPGKRFTTHEAITQLQAVLA